MDGCTYDPITATDYRGALSVRVSEREHPQIALLDNNEDVHPVLGLRTFSRGFPILLAPEHAFFGPWRAQQGELFVRYADVCRDGVITPGAMRVVFLRFPYDRVGQIGSETKRGCHKRDVRSIRAL